MLGGVYLPWLVTRLACNPVTLITSDSFECVNAYSLQLHAATTYKCRDLYARMGFDMESQDNTLTYAQNRPACSALDASIWALSTHGIP